MTDDAHADIKFFPRPEAHPMNWEQLLPPVKDAVKDLLFRIEGATRKGVKEETTANCFLVYGDRGTGKTTVLLSAKNACAPNPNKPFFPEKLGDGVPIIKAAKKSAEELKKNVIWLDVLDLEPLPAEANLLATVLTWVRNALNPSEPENQATEVTSIFEESADSARHKLNQLINDATLMWEDIHEPDTRSRANRQIAAANIYAQFRENFRKAMDTLSSELARRSGTRDNPRKLILPIDNIDRSTDHLYNIVKLAQMVSSPHLWLVMAGDRQDVDTFLERAFWKELIRIGGGAGAIGKTSLTGEDEALVMARRQAAATSHKLLPPSHRIEVKLVKPQDTLEFSLPTKNTAKTIRQLLSEISVRKGGDYLPEIRLIDLFDAKERIQNVVKDKRKKDEEYLTRAAQLGLCLPARGVLDLWQLADGIVNNDNVNGTLNKAEWIARVMLRNAIAESTMPSETGRRLQEQILGRTPSGGTMLDFWDPTGNFDSILEVLSLKSLDFELRLGQKDLVFRELKSEGEKDESNKKEGTEPVDFNLHVKNTKALNLRLKHSPKTVDAIGSLKSDSGKTELNLKYSPQGDTRISDEMLPDLVDAWITVLHDVAVLGAEDSAVISPPVISNPVEVECHHFSNHGFITGKSWPLPRWELFIARDIFEQFWQYFRSLLNQETCGINLLDQAGREGEGARLLVAGCVACALDTFLLFTLCGEPTPPGILSLLEKDFSCDQQWKPEGLKEAIKKAELNVIKCAATVYEKILRVNKSKGTVFRDNEKMMGMRYWLELELPRLLSYFYVPISGANGKTRADEIIDSLKNEELINVWKNPRGCLHLAEDIWWKLEAMRLYAPKTTPIKVGKFEDPKVATTKPIRVRPKP